MTENIQDPNTDALAKRKVTVTITFKPNKDRNFAPIDIQTKTALAPAAGTDTALSTGEMDVAEVTTGQIPGQMSIEDAQAAQVSADGRPFDADTGEILEPAGEKPSGERIVDMRRKA